jgi:methylthioribulose-1-phosphate dehydratase
MRNIVDLKNELVKTIHFFHAKGWSPATSTNYSFREDDHTNFYVSESGIDKGDFEVKNVIYVDSNGIPIKDRRRPSAETALHCLIYARTDANAILHTHTLFNTVLSRFKQSEKEIILANYEVLKGISGVKTHQTQLHLPIFDNSQDMQELSNRIDSYWKEHPNMKAFLLASHGLYTWGETIAEAKRQVEVLEFLLECEYHLLILNK